MCAATTLRFLAIFVIVFVATLTARAQSNLTCSIDKTQAPWNPPGKMNVEVDGTAVGSFNFDSNGTGSLSFACTSGSHKFTLKVDGTQVSCSGAFVPDSNHTHFVPFMRLNPDQTTVCALTSN